MQLIGSSKIARKQRAMHRTNLGLKGTVRHLLAESSSYNGWRTSEDRYFSQDGSLLTVIVQQPGRPELRLDYRYDQRGARIEPTIHVSHNADGSRTESAEVPLESSSWTMECLHSVGFRTGGARYTDTTFDSRGAPVRTVFRDHLREELSQLHYVCDEHGNVLEARENGGFLGPFRVTFQYDSEGHILERATYFGEERLHRTVYGYNERGDTVSSKTDDEPAIVIEYDYDERSNWTRKVTHHALGSDEERRRIEYWPP